jgi:AcrR family transcriptional regulator
MRQPPTRSRRRRTAYHHHDLPNALAAAAIDLVEREGLPAVTLRRLAQAVGVSPAAPYRHFASRDALLAAIATDGYTELGAVLIAARDGCADTPDLALSAQGVAYVRFAVTAAGTFRIMQAPELADRTPFPALREAIDRAFGALRGVVLGEQQAGRFPPGDPDLLALGPWAVAHGLAMLALDGQLAERTLPTHDPVALAEQLMAMRPG